MKLSLTPAILLVMLLVNACAPANTPAPTPDLNAVRTSAASTVISEFTLTAAAFTPTPSSPTETPAPEFTATATQLPVAQVTNAAGTPIELCDKYSWNDATVDVNIPDNTEMTPGQDFTKTWKIKNTGTCTWGAGYTIIYAGYSDKMSGQPQPLPAIGPGQEVDISVQFKAPAKAGEYVSAWTLANAKGVSFFGNNNKPFYVKIVVK